MSFKIKASSVVVFDLDDTLYREIDFLKSGYRKVADWLVSRNFDDPYEDMLALYHQGKPVFHEIIRDRDYPFTVEEFLAVYRNHLPDISLTEEAWAFLNKMDFTGCKTGLITDGRSVTQRNKIRALGLEDYFDKIVISGEIGSEKPSERNFEALEALNGEDYYYIGDNTAKDFITPNARGWETICMTGNSQNIHPQDFDLPEVFLPGYKVRNFQELGALLFG